MRLKRDQWERAAVVGTLLVLLLAWLFGGMRQEAGIHQKLVQATPKGMVYIAESENLWAARPAELEHTTQWLSLAKANGYGGPLEVVTAIDTQGRVSGIAVTTSAETASYLQQVISSGLVDAYLNQLATTLHSADAVTGATLTSEALQGAITSSVQHSGRHALGLDIPETAKPALTLPDWMDGLALLLFIAAIVINRPGFTHKVIGRRVVMGLSLVFLGFYAAAPFGAGTLGFVLNGFWLDGVASYTSMLLLIATFGYLLYSNKNVYCNTVCPFGAAQECIGKLNKAKACKSNHPLVIWTPRLLLTVALAMGLYFRNPSSFSFEPFGMAFNMIGGPLLFALTIAIVLTSLFVSKPWCQSLCPVSQVAAFTRVAKQWVKSSGKKARTSGNTESAKEKPHAK